MSAEEDEKKTTQTPGGYLLKDALNRRISIAFETINYDNDGTTKLLKYYPGTITDIKLSSNHRLHGGSKYLPGGDGIPASSFLHYVIFDDGEEWWIDLHQVKNIRWLRPKQGSNKFLNHHHSHLQQQRNDEKKSAKYVDEKKKPGRPPKTPTRAGKKNNSFVTPSPSTSSYSKNGNKKRRDRVDIDCSSLKLAALDEPANDDSMMDSTDNENDNRSDEPSSDDSDSDYVHDDEEQEEDKETTSASRKRRRNSSKAAKSKTCKVAKNPKSNNGSNKKPKRLSEKEKKLKLAASNCHPITSYFARKP